MFIRRKHRDVPELNTTSTADISFMLLVFFLVTSSMNADKGLGRKLSPIDEQKQEVQDINRSNVMQIALDANNLLTVDEKPATLAELQQQVESFVASRQSDRHVIAVQTDRKTSYQAYFEMQNAILLAYRALRNKMARKQFGHNFSECSPDERDIIIRKYPQRISEGMVTDTSPMPSSYDKKGGSR